MATKLYFKSATGGTRISPAKNTTMWTGTGGSQHTYAQLLTAPDGADTLAAGTQIAWGSGVSERALDRIYVSPPIGSTTQISGTVSMQLQMREFEINDDVTYSAIRISIYKSDGTLRAELKNATYSTQLELNNSTLTNRTCAASVSLDAVTPAIGDYLVVDVGFKTEATAAAPNAQARYGSSGSAGDLVVDNASQATDRNGWIEFSHNFVWQPTTRLYFASALSAPVSPSWSVSWTSTTGALRYRLLTAKPTAGDGRAVGDYVSTTTQTAGRKIAERMFVSQPLAAQTIAGAVRRGQIQVREDGNGSNLDQIITKAWVAKPDLSQRGLLWDLAAKGNTLEYRSGTPENRVLANHTPVGEVSVTAGDYLVLEVGHSNLNAAISNPGASGVWGTLIAADNPLTDLPEDETQDGTTYCGWIDFPGTILLYQPDAGGTIAGTATVTASISGSGNLGGTVVITSTVDASITYFHLEGTIDGTSSVTAEISGVGQIAGTIDAVSAITGAFEAQTQVGGTIDATSSVEGELTGVGYIAGTITAEGTVTGAVAAQPAPFDGTIEATSTVTASVVGVGLVAGTVDGAAAIEASIGGVGLVGGTIAGVSAVTAYLAVPASLSDAIWGWDAISMAPISAFNSEQIARFGGTIAAVSSVSAEVIEYPHVIRGEIEAVFTFEASIQDALARFDGTINGAFDFSASVVGYGLIGGRIGGDMTAEEIEAAVLDAVVEGSLTLREALRLLLAVAAGQSEITDLGGGAATVVFRDTGDVTDRVTATMAGSERTTVVLDPS